MQSTIDHGKLPKLAKQRRSNGPWQAIRIHWSLQNEATEFKFSKLDARVLAEI